MNEERWQLQFEGYQFEEVEEVSRGGSAIIYKAYSKSKNRYYIIKEFCPKVFESFFSRSDSHLLVFGADVDDTIRSTITKCCSNFKNESLQSNTLFIDTASNSNYIFHSELLNAPCSDSAYLLIDTESGRALSEILDAKNTTMKQKLRITSNIMHALYQAFWKKGYIHCDIKPANIFVLDNYSVKIIDIGSAYKLDEPVNDQYSSIGSSTDEYASKKMMMIARKRELLLQGNTTQESFSEEVRKLSIEDDIYAFVNTILSIFTGETAYSINDMLDSDIFITNSLSGKYKFLAKMLLFLCEDCKGQDMKTIIDYNHLLMFMREFEENLMTIENGTDLFFSIDSNEFSDADYVDILLQVLNISNNHMVCDLSIVLDENIAGKYAYTIKNVLLCNYCASAKAPTQYVKDAFGVRFNKNGDISEDRQIAIDEILCCNTLLELSNYLVAFQNEYLIQIKYYDEKVKLILRVLVAANRFGVARRSLEYALNKRNIDKSIISEMLNESLISEDSFGLLRCSISRGVMYDNLAMDQIDNDFYKTIVIHSYDFLKKDHIRICYWNTLVGACTNPFVRLDSIFNEAGAFLIKNLSKVKLNSNEKNKLYSFMFENGDGSVVLKQIAIEKDLKAMAYMLNTSINFRMYSHFEFDRNMLWDGYTRGFIVNNLHLLDLCKEYKCFIISTCYYAIYDEPIETSYEEKEALIKMFINSLPVSEPHFFLGNKWRRVFERAGLMIHNLCELIFPQDLLQDFIAKVKKSVYSLTDLGNPIAPMELGTIGIVFPIFAYGHSGYALLRKFKQVYTAPGGQYYFEMVLSCILWGHDKLQDIIECVCTIIDNIEKISPTTLCNYWQFNGNMKPYIVSRSSEESKQKDFYELNLLLSEYYFRWGDYENAKLIYSKLSSMLDIEMFHAINAGRYNMGSKTFIKFREHQLLIIQAAKFYGQKIKETYKKNLWHCLDMANDISFEEESLKIIETVDNFAIQNAGKFLIGDLIIHCKEAVIFILQANVLYNLLEYYYRTDEYDKFVELYPRLYNPLSEINSKHLDLIIYNGNNVVVLMDNDDDTLDDHSLDILYSERWQKNLEFWMSDLLKEHPQMKGDIDN